MIRASLSLKVLMFDASNVRVDRPISLLLLLNFLRCFSLKNGDDLADFTKLFCRRNY